MFFQNIRKKSESILKQKCHLELSARVSDFGRKERKFII